MKKLRNTFLSLLAVFGLCLSASMVYRALPLCHKRELSREVVSKKQLKVFLSQPSPEWVLRQLDADFAPFTDRKITAEAVQEMYEEIRAKIGPQILHYRILNNRLYKYFPSGAEYSSRDTAFERAFKTLLTYTKVPDVDFLLCPMDGIPEPYVPQDFFLSANGNNQVPILGQAKRKEPASQYIVLIPDQFSLTESWLRDLKDVKKVLEEVRWEDKKEVALWRGQLTDVGIPGDYCPNLHECPRFKIAKLAVEHPNLINAGINEAHSPQTITLLSQAGVIRGSAGKKEHLLCKYLPVLDGHMCTYPGFQWRLLSNSVVFKQESDQIQWFYGAVKPYEHYVPVKNDMSDLVDQISWAQAHDERVRAISENAQAFARQNLMPTHNYAYLFKVLSRYAEHQKIDFRKLKTATRKDPRWECIQYRKRTSLMRTLRKFMQFGKPLAGGVGLPNSLDQTAECKAALQGSF